jgi:hypothetical protein
MATQQTRPMAQRTEQRRYSLAMLVGLAFIFGMLAVCNTASAAPVAVLEADAPYQLIGEAAKLTATASYFPTSVHMLRIYDKTTSTHLKSCSSSPCQIPVVQGEPTKHTYVAYIAKQGNRFPPPGIESSDEVDVTWSSSVVLNTDKTHPWEGQAAELTAESYGYPAWLSTFVLIGDMSSGTIVTCPWSTHCSTSVTEGDGPVEHTYYALQAVWVNGIPNPPQVVRPSNQVTVRWEEDDDSP